MTEPTQASQAPFDAAQSVPPSVQRAAAWSWRLLLIVAAAAVGVYAIGALKVVIVPIAVAVLVTILLTPVVAFFQRRLRMSRALASGIALAGLIVLVAALLTVAGASIVRGFGDLGDQAREGVDKVTAWLADGPLGLTTDDLTQWADKLQDLASSSGGSGLVSGALHGAVTVGHVAAGALIAVFCTFFFLLDGRTIWSWVVGLLPRGTREHVHQAARRGLVTLGAYTRTQILVAAVDALGIGIGAAILHVPLALPLAILVFLGSFIPIVGALLTGTIAVLVALVAQGPVVALIMLGVVLLVQQLEGHVLQPFLMGHAVSLHPVAVLLAVAAGSFVAGILGALFAVPIVAVINTVVLYLHGHDKFPQLGTEDHVAVRGRGHPALDLSIAQVAENSAADAASDEELGADAAVGKDASPVAEDGK
ncbi:AI-2E family transporter [Cellulomonas sp. PhB150]|uniref:AI-2E family transporter n=1 Tax=Cellulomonas sp. PhB150 TaxID=2485188 RepID=UPI000F46ABA6|nr:AI-2E family transporter [Cellulomonas sp. PhB150]ROS23024.1 putative PurR-regulated permease PerM [Cellulomonas sp. PhB150]